MVSERSLTKMTADERRASLIAAGSDVFARRGFHGASTAEIASLAGCSEPMLYKHFASKQELFGAVLVAGGTAIKAQVQGALEGADDPFTRMLAVVQTLIADPAWLQLVRLRSLAVTMADDPAIRAALEAHVRGHRDTVAGAVGASQELGTVRGDVDADAVGWIAVALSLLANYRNAIEGPAGLADMPRIIDTLAHAIRTVPEGSR